MNHVTCYCCCMLDEFVRHITNNSINVTDEHGVVLKCFSFYDDIVSIILSFMIENYRQSQLAKKYSLISKFRQGILHLYHLILQFSIAYWISVDELCYLLLLLHA